MICVICLVNIDSIGESVITYLFPKTRSNENNIPKKKLITK